jgi:phage terminase large subunit
MDTRRFNMIYGGQFDKAEGLVYDCFDENIHVVDPLVLPHDTRYYAGIDWGYRDPFIISVRAVTPLGMHYNVAEFAEPQKTLSEMKEAAWRFKRLFNIEMFYADPSRPDYINEFCRDGITTIAAQNDIRIGIDSHYELIKEGRYQVFRNTSPYLLDEYSQYHYPELKDLKPDQNTKDELPVDQNNHTMDCQRYVTMATYKRYGHKPNRVHIHSDVYDLSKSSKSVYYDSEHSKLYKPSKKKNNHIL